MNRIRLGPLLKGYNILFNSSEMKSNNVVENGLQRRGCLHLSCYLCFFPTQYSVDDQSETKTGGKFISNDSFFFFLIFFICRKKYLINLKEQLFQERVIDA